MNKPLYEEDFFAWTQAQADVLRRRSPNEIDWDNLQEEVESLGRQERGELHNRLVQLLTHLLKWEFQSDRRSRSGALTIAEQRREAERVLRGNPSLKPQMAEIIAEAYGTARLRAARQTRKSLKAFPTQSPYDWQIAMTMPVEWDD